jgi:predicted Fe-S protein YdhL (DUF1289 family)
MSSNEPVSPCISVCLLDNQDICQGCYRSAEEIADWFIADADGKREILTRARHRMEQATSIRLN